MNTFRNLSSKNIPGIVSNVLNTFKNFSEKSFSNSSREYLNKLIASFRIFSKVLTDNFRNYFQNSFMKPRLGFLQNCSMIFVRKSRRNSVQEDTAETFSEFLKNNFNGPLQKFFYNFLKNFL